MNPTLFFSVLAVVTGGPWLCVLLFGPAPIENSLSGGTRVQLWLICSPFIGIGGIGVWLGMDRQHEIAQRCKVARFGAARLALVIRRRAHPTLSSPKKARLRVVGGTALRRERPPA